MNFNQKITRRGVLRGTVASATMLAAPAIIGRASPAAAQSAFAGESLIVVSWSGNHERSFRESVIGPFNEQFGTKVETTGGWDQMVAQIKAAPANSPPFDLTIADEYTSAAGVAENLFLEADRSKIPGFDAILPWFDELRGDARKFGVPFGGGSLWMAAAKSSGINADSWKGFWDPAVSGKTTLDAASFYWDLCIPALLSKQKPGIDELFGSQADVEALFQELDKLKVAKWYKDGAELSNLLVQETAQVASIYSADAYGFMQEFGSDFEIKIPAEGTSSYTNWFMKVRGTKHSDLADKFQAYLLEKDTQQRFLENSTDFMSRRDLTAPKHWPDYPTSDEAIRKTFNLFTLKGWEVFGANWDPYSNRMKETISKTTAG